MESAVECKECLPMDQVRTKSAISRFQVLYDILLGKVDFGIDRAALEIKSKM